MNMPTNPQPPLSAESDVLSYEPITAKDFESEIYELYDDAHRGLYGSIRSLEHYQASREKAVQFLEAYAAQQNTGLMAENQRLKSLLEEIDEHIKNGEIDYIKELLKND